MSRKWEQSHSDQQIILGDRFCIVFKLVKTISQIIRISRGLSVLISPRILCVVEKFTDRKLHERGQWVLEVV